MTNSRPKLTLDFDIEDVPWLLHALRIQYNTAMMYGHQDTEKVKVKIKSYVDAVASFYPVLAEHDLEEYVLFNALNEIKEAKKWTIVRKGNKWNIFREIELVVDDVVYRITSGRNKTEEFLNDLKAFITEYAPLGAEYYEAKNNNDYQF